ncbi:MAG: helix-turn-helix transcriptional regulator [Solirubrobacterales bacterium]
MRIDAQLTDAAVLDQLGSRLKRTRLQHNLTQRRLAEEAGVSLATVRNLEDGRPSQLVTLIRVLRVLGLLGGLERAVPEPPPSPVEELRLRGRERQRASSPRYAQ